MSLSSKTALVLGGCGNVGSGCTVAFLKLGYGKVVVISRDPTRLDNLRQQIGELGTNRLICVLGDINNEAAAEAAKQEVLGHCGEVDDIVSCIGFSWWQKGLLKDQSRQELESTLNSLVVAPFVAFKTFLPLVQSKNEGTFTFVTGGGADMFLCPGTGFMSVGGAASQGLARIALKEHAQDPVTVTEVSFLVGVTPVPDKMPPAFTWIHNIDAGAAIANAILKRTGRGKTSTVTSHETLASLGKDGFIA